MNKCFFAVILACFFSILKIKDGKSLPATNVNTTIFNNGSTTKNTTIQIQDEPGMNHCDVSYIKIGCYQDSSIENSSFPSMILKPIFPLLDKGKAWSLRGESWNKFLENFVCTCARTAKQFNYNYFGIKRFDQCWSGDTTLYYRNPTSNGCLELDMNSCNSASSSPCAGNSTSVFVYRL